MLIALVLCGYCKKNDMKLYLSKMHSNEDRPFAKEGKSGIICSSREDIIKQCDFFAEIKIRLNSTEVIHLHFILANAVFCQLNLTKI